MTQRSLAAGVAGAAGLIAALTLLARATGFVRVVVFADAVRAGGVGEIYQAVNAVPNVLFEIAAGGILAAVAVPLVARHLATGDSQRADSLGSALLSWTVLLLVPTALLLALAAPAVVGTLVTPRDPQSHAVAVTMLRVFSVQVPLYGVGIVLTGILHAHRRFLAAALAPLLSSVVVLTAYVIYGQLVGGATAPSDVPAAAIAVLAWGTTAGVAVLSLPLLIPAYRSGWRYRPTLRLHPEDRSRILALAGAGLATLLAQQGVTMITLWLTAGSADVGTLPVQQYAQAVYLLPYAVIAVPIATSAFPAMAEGAAVAQPAGDALVSRSLRAMLALTGIAVAVLVAAAPAIGAFFTALDARRGVEGSSSTALQALPVAITTYAPGLVGFAIVALLARAVYVRGVPWQAAGIVASGWAIAGLVPLIWLTRGAPARLTLWTLGVSWTLGMTLAALALVWLVRRTWGAASVAGLARTAGATIVAMAVGVGAGDVVGGQAMSPEIGTAVLHGLGRGAVALIAAAGVLALGDRHFLAGAVRAGRQRRRMT